MARLFPRLPRSFPRLALLALAALAACSGAGAPEPIACQERSQCPTDAFCRAGACVRSAAPLALISAVDAVAPRANRVLAFDAAASRDPDAEDHVATYAWRSVRTNATCEPAVVGSDGPRYRVLFPCAGAFRVELTVTDSTGVPSAPAAIELAVVADEVAAPVLETGAALTLDHACSGEPLACTPVDGSGATSFGLSAATLGGAGTASLRWTVTPPAGLTSPHSVTFSDPASPAPIVSLRSAGRIAGTWTFTAVATDAAGRAAVAEQKVTIGNRPPAAVRPLSLAVNHAYDGAAQVLRAEGRLPDDLQIVDPDGDPVTLRYSGEAAGDGGHGITVREDGSFAIAVPAGEPQHLIGAGVERRIVIAADDGNGSAPTARITVPVTVLNRAPRIASTRAVATVPHRYDPARKVYVASASLSEYVDDDGDPMLAGTAREFGSRSCQALSIAGSVVQLGCEVPLTTVAALSTLATTHLVEVTVRDAWTESAPAAARVEVTNAAPIVASSTLGVGATRWIDWAYCCEWDGGDDCITPRTQWGAGGLVVQRVLDPDDDPLDVTYETTSPVAQLSRSSATACRSDDCATELRLPVAGSLEQCVAIDEPGHLRISVSDGASSAQGTLLVWRKPL